MRRNRLLYYLVNITFVLLALCFVNYRALTQLHLEAPTIIVWSILLFLLIHILRFARMYFILLEDLIKPSRFLQLYIKTTFVSSLIPFKIGEIFKMYCYGVETNNALKGVMAVIIEKFFDALILCAVMVPYGMLGGGSIGLLAIVLLIFIVCVAAFYFSFKNTYRYLNRFLICRGGGKKSLAALKALEMINKTYEEAKNILRGRAFLLLFLSALAWVVECFMFMLVSTGGINIDLGAIFGYINDAFFGVENAAFVYYVSLLVIIFTLILVVIYGRKYAKILIGGKRDSWRN